MIPKPENLPFWMEVHSGHERWPVCRVRFREKETQAERRSGAWEAHGCGVFTFWAWYDVPCRGAHPKGQERRKEK